MKKTDTIILFALLMLPLSAMAYVDPAGGMMAWQGLLAACGAGAMFAGRFWRSIKEVIARIFRK
jgi:hypothetical protein